MLAKGLKEHMENGRKDAQLGMKAEAFRLASQLVAFSIGSGLGGNA